MISLLQRRWRAWRDSTPEYQQFYRHWPFDLDVDYRQAKMLALDLEMTGLNPSRDQIVAIGAVVVDGGGIDMATALALNVEIDGTVGDSATIHGIRDCDLVQALPLAEALKQLLLLMEGRILVCHHAPLDLAFLKRAFKQEFGESLPLKAIDTLAIEHGRFQRSPNGATEALDLNSCRLRYQLPPYHGHHALWDAIACAELLFAQARTMAGRQPLPLKALV